MRARLSDMPPAYHQELVDLLEDSTQVGTWDWNIADNTFLWSERQFAHFGLHPTPTGTIEYQSWLQAIHPKDRETVQAALTDTIATGNRLDLTYRVLRRDDAETRAVDVRWLQSRGSLIRANDGSPLRMVGISHDVTHLEQGRSLERARLDAELVDKFAGPSRFDVLFQSSPDCLVQMKVERDGRFTYQMINPAGLKVIGMTMEAARGLTPPDVLGEENGGLMNEALRSVAETGLPVRYEPTFAYARQSVIYDATYMPMFDDRAVVTTILCRARDVTQERRTAAALQQAQKMEALGQLAAGVSHDFNNLLMGLCGCFLRLGRLSTTDEMDGILELGALAVRQGESLTRQLLTFARQHDVALRDVDLNASLASSLQMCRVALRDVRFIAKPSDVPCVVKGDQGLIEACVLNLCINARDAQPQGCEIVLEAQVLPDGTSPHIDLPSGRYACLSITDNGPGMSAEVLAKAMDPFFTTKPVGKGTGLGLSMVYGTARSFSGGVAIQSSPGSGTVVTIFFAQSEST